MPKTFTYYSRFEKGINTRFDDADIGAESLAECDGWSVNTLGSISTIADFKASTLFAIDEVGGTTAKDYIGSGFSGITVRSDVDFNHITNLTGTASEAGYSLFFYGTDDGYVGVINQVEGGTPSHIGAFFQDAPAIGSNNKPNFLWHEGELRWSNALHDADTKPHWMGYLSRTRFSSSDAWNTLNKWVVTDVGIVAPSYASGTPGNGIIRKGIAIASHIPSSAGGAPNVSFDITSNNEDGTWASSDFEFGMTYVYRGNQESKVAPMQIHTGGALVDSINLPKRQYFTSLAVSIRNSAASPFDERMTGFKVYARKFNGGKRWRLLMEADFERGTRLNTFDTFENTWIRPTSSPGQYYSSTSLNAISPSIETYEASTGVLNDEYKISFSDDSSGWSDAVAVGRRIFYIGCKYYDNQTFKVLNDRVFYSQPASPDVVPMSNWIDLGINDGDQFVAVQSFSSRLCLFKRNKVYILNVQAGNPAGWGLEQEIDNNGVEYQTNVVNTRYGIIWANKYGCFMYGGQGVQELSMTLSPSFWLDNLGASASKFIIGMNNVTNQLYVMVTGDATKAAVDGVWVYNFDSQGWTRFSSSAYSSNEGFFNTIDGQLHYHSKPISSYTAFSVNEDLGNSSTNRTFTLKEDTFGSAGTMKRFYNFKIELLNDANSSLQCFANGVSVGTKTLTSANADYVTKIFTPANPIESDRLQLKFISNASGGVSISNITVEYRSKRLRVTE